MSSQRYFLITVLIIITFHGNQLHAMESKSVSPIILKKEEIVPDESLFPLTQPQFDDLINKASRGNAKSQYILGVRYFQGLTPTKKPDLVEAEQWLLKARSQDYLPAFSLLVDLAIIQNNPKKEIVYAQAAVERGFLEQNYNVGIAYERQKQYKNAKKYFENTINSLEAYQNYPYFKLIRDDALVHLADFFKKGLGGPKNIQKAMEILTKLAADNNIQAMYLLAIAYLYGNEVIQKNPKDADILLSKIEKLGKPKTIDEITNYLRSLNLHGWMFEKGWGIKPNFNKAVEYYEKASFLGGFHIARLILTRKIPGDYEQAKKLLKDASSANILAAFFYGTILISEGDQEEGMVFLENIAPQQEYPMPLAHLQLGIAYRYGFGVEQNETKAQEYFKKIMDDQDLSHRSSLLARGYMYLFGLGDFKKDIKKGLALIDKSETQIDDVYFTTDQLFPAIIKLRAEHAELMAKSLIEQEEAQKKKRKKKKGAAPEVKTESKKVDENPFKVTKEEWNAYFDVNDGSRVSVIDAEKKLFVIDDPAHNEQLIVKVKEFPNRDFTEIEALQFHNRILKRQGLTKKRLKQSTIYNHTFAEMLDYVIQYVGEHVPFTKDGRSEKNDQLVATVIRKNLETGEETECMAEYTFGQRGDDIYVYHRLLRPIKKVSAIKITNMTRKTKHIAFDVSLVA